jgi:acryloyl-coenzyme A reductase
MTPARVRLVATGWERDLVHEEECAPPPPPAGTHVVVEVEACGVCHRDLLDREGRFPFQRLPIVPGHEASGRVVAVGPDVTDFAPGDRVGTLQRDSCGACPRCRAGDPALCERAAWVLGILADGGYATHMVVPQAGLYALPGDLAPEAAAILCCTFGTAYRDLATLGRVAPGERVLVTGANGGVGLAAVQVARRLGARVVAVVRDGRHRARLESLGAEEVLVDDGARFHGRTAKVDLALEAVGQPTFGSALRALRTGGRMVICGNVVPEKVGLNLGYLITYGITLAGASGANRTEMAALLELHRREPLAFVAERVPLASADAAQRRVKAGGLEGRLVLVP